ncbi:MAG: amidase [SAR86 cluster bacterium]|uniref:Amidase n=1 Tax=SAR86 cluster bacterium TaxID=2030880 RepID=A0A2A5AT21_9GAMM|nr:MAG: amidase [SAR86 cluster bacterium]
MPADITSLSATDLSSAIRQRQISCVEVMQAYLNRIHKYNPTYNAIVSLVEDDNLLAQAADADRALDQNQYRGRMHGMPHAVKDLTNVAGMRTTSGSPIYANRIAENDSLLVSRIRAQGAIFIGKTNTPEFGLGSQSYNTVFGATGSACNPALTAGGSSGGAASGLGTHMLPVADGSDMMGSLRNPGAFNNIIGFRPTSGRVPGGDVFYQRLSTSGPLGRNTEDTIRLLNTLAGATSDQPLSLSDNLPGVAEFTPHSPNVKIGWMGSFENYLPMEPGVLELCESSLQLLEDAGAVVEPCMPNFDMAQLWQAWLDLRHWSRTGAFDLYENPITRAQLKPEYIWEIENSLELTAAQVYRAGSVRANWFLELNRMFDEYDFLVQPTAQVFPFSKDLHWPKEINGTQMDTYHRWMEVVIGGTLAGLPVVNVPVGFDAQGRPMGMQIMGRFGEDQKVLEFAMTYESISDHLNRRPELVSS